MDQTRMSYSAAKRLIKSYYYLKAQYRDALDLAAVTSDGMPRGSGISDPTAQRAAAAEAFKEKLDIIEKPLGLIPEDYRQGVFDNLTRGKPFPDTAAEATWKNWRQRYIIAVAALKDYSFLR